MYCKMKWFAANAQLKMARPAKNDQVNQIKAMITVTLRTRGI